MTQSSKKFCTSAALGALVVVQLVGAGVANAQTQTQAQATTPNWDIQDFNSTIQINADNSIDVTEHIVADFSREEHHGIYRDFFLKFSDSNGMLSQVPIHVQSVTDEVGKAWKYTVTVSDKVDNVEIKIGDPHVLLNGVETYNISYKVDRTLKILMNDEEYMGLERSVTGDQWDVPIQKAEATVKLPEVDDTSKLKQWSYCSTGGFGSVAYIRDLNCMTDVVDGKTIQFNAVPSTVGGPALNPGGGMTILAGFSGGGVDIISDNLPVFSDVPPSSQYWDALLSLKGKGIVSGYADGSFKPDNLINRAEFTKIVVGAVYPETQDCAGTTSTFNFSDIVKTAWYADFVCMAFGDQIISGYPDGTFGPAKNINYVEAAKILVNAFKIPTAPPTAGQAWYQGYVNTLVFQKVVPTSITTMDHLMTRGEMAEMIFQIKLKNGNYAIVPM